MNVHPPGPQDRFFGIGLIRRFRAQPLEFITQLARDHGDLAYLRLGPLRTYFVFRPTLIREVLVSKHKSFRRPPMAIKPLRQIDGNGLVLSEGELWRRQRRLVQPAFSPKRFDRYAQVIVDNTQRMIDRWQDQQSLDIAEEMTSLTLHIIAKTLFDVEIGSQVEELGRAVRVLSQTVFAESGNPLTLPDWFPTASKRRKRQALRTLDELAWRLIRERRAAGDDRGDLLSMLLMAVDEEGDGQGMTDVQVRDEAVTLFNAGHDSTAAALAWIWYLIARHPAVESELIEEIDGALAGRTPNYTDVARLPYCEMVVKESLRLYPPTWTLLPREAVERVELGGYQVPRGAWVYVFPWVTQRDPRYFEHPEKFDPRRFAPGRTDEIPPYAYFPFGGGPRVCIGSAFATMEMVLILASVLQRYRVRLAAGHAEVRPEPLIAIRPRGGLRVALHRRDEPALASSGTQA